MSTIKFWQTGRKIVAVGRNFANHAKELGNAVPTAPFFFMKPTSSYLLPGGAIEVPPGCDVHHEVELGVVISKKGRDISAKSAMDYVAGYTLALDMTARNLQNKAKEKGLPWTAAKGYDTFTPIAGQVIPKEKIPDPSNVELWLKVDGKLRQKGSTNQMIFNIPSLIEAISSIMTLEEGDLILTGTPEGVDAVKPGQVVEAGITGVIDMKFPVVARPTSKL